jgi:ribosome-binding protein aMBF1 (putative translation factor)
MSFVCPNCGHVGSTTRKLSDWEVAEMRRRAERVMVEHPRNPWKGERDSRLRHLAADYGINVRTLYRYLERAA